MKEHWKLKMSKLDCVVYKVMTLSKPAQQAGIIPKPNRKLEGKAPRFDNMLASFGVDNVEGFWRHNGANDAVY